MAESAEKKEGEKTPRDWNLLCTTFFTVFVLGAAAYALDSADIVDLGLDEKVNELKARSTPPPPSEPIFTRPSFTDSMGYRTDLAGNRSFESLIAEGEQKNTAEARAQGYRLNSEGEWVKGSQGNMLLPAIIGVGGATSGVLLHRGLKKQKTA